ncbi:hypothetical protein MKK50_18180 [Methylobacterium sp. J-043]|nr:hypothetical protein [Methylobacterium sp. J-043]
MSLLGELTYALISPPNRSLGGIIPDVIIEELHRDELIVTEFPVEIGASITDHAYKRPAALQMRCGFSNSSAGAVGYVQAVYQALLALQASRRPFTVYTGKRRYRNMLISGLDVITDRQSEHALMVVVGMREVILTTTLSRSASSQNDAKPAADQSKQAQPEATAATTDSGTKQLQPYDGFTGRPDSLGLLPSGADAGTGDFQFGDGTILPGGSATGLTGLAPSQLPGNLGLFGSYGPGAFAGTLSFEGASPAAPTI